MSLPNLIVFDLDGTLNRTDLYAVAAHRRVMEHYSTTHFTDQQILSMFGASDSEFFDQMLPHFAPEQRREYLTMYSQFEGEEIEKNSASFPHIPEMLTELRAAGCRTAICSNASVRYIRMVLTQLNLLHLIDFIQPIEPGLAKDDTLRKLLSQVVHNRAVMVGDRFYDKNAARSNGLPFIGCSYGFAPAEVADADIAVTDAAQIPAAATQLLQQIN